MRGDTEPGHVDQRVERRVRIELADRLEDLLAAAHAGQPVVDDGDAPGHARSAWRSTPVQWTSAVTIDPRHRRQIGRPPCRFRGRAGPTLPRELPRPHEPSRRSSLAQALVGQHAPHRVGDRRPDRSGSTSTAASPTTSGSDETFEVITGVPLAIASSGGRPKPS